MTWKSKFIVMKLHEFDMIVSRWADEVHNIVILRLIQSAASGQYVSHAKLYFLRNILNLVLHSTPRRIEISHDEKHLQFTASIRSK